MSDTQTVFRLRKEGKVDEALKIARILIKNDPNDEWTIKAYGWSLISKISNTKNQEQLNQLRNELTQLSVSKNDDILYNSTQKALNPFSNKIKEAGSLSKEKGNHWKAKNILSEILTNDPYNQEALNTLGWVYYRLLGDKKLSNKDNIIVELIEILPKFSENNTLLIRQLAIITSKANSSYESYHEFFKTCLLPNLSSFPSALSIFDNLYSDNEHANNKSLEEISIKGMYRHLKKYSENRIMVSEWFNDTLLSWKNIRWDDDVWGTYYYGRLLAWCTDKKELALSKLSPIARFKKNEFWIWDAIADCLSSIDMKIACYCQSINCKVQEENYLINIYLELVQLWKIEGNFAECAYIANKAKNLYISNNRNLPENLQLIIDAEWFDPNQISKENFKRKTKEHAEKINEIIYQDLPIIPVNFISENYNSDKNKYYSEFVLENKTQCSIKLDSSINLNPGDCANVKVQNNNDRKHVVWWKKRVGQKWDLLEIHKAIVIHINRQKEFLLASFSKDDNTIIHYDNFPKAKDLKIGDFINVRIIKNRKNKYNTIEWSNNNDNVFPDFACYFKGDFNFADDHPFGFVNTKFGEIFISPNFTKKLKDGENIKGIAVYQHKPNRNEYGWKALIIDHESK